MEILNIRARVNWRPKKQKGPLAFLLSSPLQLNRNSTGVPLFCQPLAGRAIRVQRISSPTGEFYSPQKS
jgi:hypothetical protein